MRTVGDRLHKDVRDIKFDLPYFVGQEKVDEWEREIREAVRREAEAAGIDPEQVMRVLRCE